MPTDNPTTPISTSFEHLVWRPVDPNQPAGPQIAVLWGDPTSGPFGALLRVPVDFESPMHSHSQDERVVQLRGRSVHWTQDGSRETAPTMTPGDFMMMPRGVQHVSATAGDEESIEFITMDGAFDFTVADTEPREE